MKSIRYFLLPKISNLICQAAFFAYRCYGNRDDRHGQNTERLAVLLLTLLSLFVLFASFPFLLSSFFCKRNFFLIVFDLTLNCICFAYDEHLLILRILQGIVGCLLNLYVMFLSGRMDIPNVS